ncbi:MAG: SurA N-terminal domain-containing protein [Spirochaetota bacterium]|jgi:hypothetical protein|nr:SurA N-terminal domain-containing protein [Spirochaetota bacterium]
MPKHIQNHPSVKKDQWDLKRILSTIFIVFISGLLILLFITGDIASSCGGGGAAQGLLAKIDGRSVYYQQLGDEMNALQAENRNAGQEIDHEAILDQALDRHIARAVLLYGVKKSGLELAEATQLENLQRYLQQAEIPVSRFGSASKSWRREMERKLNEEYLCETFQSDIFAAPNPTELSLRIENEVRSKRVTVDLVYIDLRNMANAALPREGELETWFMQEAKAAGSETWRRAKSFEALNSAMRQELLDSWKKANFAQSYYAAFQETGDKMKTLEEGMAAGKNFALAAREAGVPLVQTAPFSWGEEPQAAGVSYPVNADFFRQALTLQPGSTSGVIKIPDDFPMVYAIFQVRARQNAPGINIDLVSNREDFQKLPQWQQDEMRQNLRSLADRQIQQVQYALFQEILNFYYKQARVTRLQREKEI